MRATRAFSAIWKGGLSLYLTAILLGPSCEVPNPAYDIEISPGDAAAVGTGGMASGSGGATGTDTFMGTGGTAGGTVAPEVFDASVADAPGVLITDAIVVVPVDTSIRDLGRPDVVQAVCPQAQSWTGRGGIFKPVAC